MLKTLRIGATTAALTVMLATSVFAGPYDVNKTNTGLAIRGYDPVAYFTDKKPTPGSFAITVVHNDATYRFANEENKKKFMENPEAYLPQYGGYCAFGLAQGVKVDADPELWTVVDDKLYLNLAPPVQKRWESDIPGFIKGADTKWSELENTDPLKTLN
ncbi:MAG: YHS domain-containing (seleno)protein [Pseudomonadota bacterium]